MLCYALHVRTYTCRSAFVHARINEKYVCICIYAYVARSPRNSQHTKSKTNKNHMKCAPGARSVPEPTESGLCGFYMYIHA